jgi:hypothetical protein
LTFETMVEADMKPTVAALAGIALLGSTSACDYASNEDLQNLRAHYIATHDTMVALWEAVDSLNDIVSLIAMDTVPRPKCIPRCVELSPAPSRDPFGN